MPIHPVTSNHHRNAALYAVGLMLIVVPALDFIQGALPVKPGTVEWRFGAIGLLSGFLITPLLGLLLIAHGANGLGHRLTIRVLAVIELAAATVFVFLVVAFMLDAVQLRRQVPQTNQQTFDYTIVRALAKYGIGIVVYSWLGLALLWDLKRSAPDAAEPKVRTPLVRSAPKSEAGS